MALIIFILLIFFIILIDKKLYKTYYTPSVFLSIPFLFICIIYILNSKKLGFFEFNYDILYIWIIGLFFFWITGVITYYLIPKARKNITVDAKKKNIKVLGDMLTDITFFISFILSYYLYIAYKLFSSSGGDAVEEYLGSGIQGHLIVIFKFLSIISFLVIFGNNNKIFKLKSLYIVLVAMSLSIMYATKSGILILLISYFFSWVFFLDKKIKIWQIIAALLVGFGIFYISYSLLFGDFADVDFIWNHMILYYVSGTASMNAYFSNNSNEVGIDPGFLFRTVSNIIYILTGDSADVKNVISNEWTYIGNDSKINVKTFFGTIYLYGGLWIGILSTIWYSFIVNLFFLLSKKNFIFLVLYVLILSMLCFGWFDFYFNTLAFYESIFFALILNFILIKKTT